MNDIEPIEYHIRRWVIGSSPFVSITESEYLEIVQAHHCLNELLGAEEKFDAVLENYVDLEETVFHESLNHLVFSDFDTVQFQRRRNHVGRRILNLLASCRLYLDALPQHADAVLGKGSKSYQQITEAPSHEYDNSLAYRAMETLRNYAQHSELPVHGISLGGSQERDETGTRFSFSFIPRLFEEELIRNPKFKPGVRIELFADTKQIELMPLVREYIERLGNIHQKFRETTEKLSRAWEDALQIAESHYTTAFPDEKILGLAAAPMKGRLKAGEPTYLHRGTYRPYLKQKNASTKNFSKRFVKW